MQRITTRLALILWALLCAGLYAGSAGIKSVIREDIMGEWGALIPKLARISPIPYLVSWLWALIGALVCCGAFLALGHALLRKQPLALLLQKGTTLRSIAYTATAFIVGQGVLSVVFLGLAMNGWLTPPASALIVLAALITGIPGVRTLLAQRSRDAVLFTLPVKMASDYPVLLVLSIIALGLTSFFVTSRISFDASAAYFSDAKLAALTHSARYFTSFGFVTSAVQSSMNYAAVIQLFGDQSARLFSWLAGLSVIALAIALGEEFGLARRPRVILLVLLVTTTSLMDLMGDGKVDLLSAAPALAAVYWVVLNSDHRPDGSVVAGFLAGMAMAERPFNMFLMPAVLALIGLLSVLQERQKGQPGQYRRLAITWLWIGAGALPWIAWILISNWGVLSSPFAVATEYMKLRTGAYPKAFPANAVWAFRLLYPLSVTFINQGQSLGNISPLFVGLLPLLMIKRVRGGTRLSPALQIGVTSAVLTLVLWLVGTAMVFETRYVIFLWIILYMPAAVWISSALENGDGLIKAFVGIALAWILVFISVRTVYFAIDTYSPVDAQGNPHCYDMDRCIPLQTVNENAGPGERVLMLNAFRYYLRKDLFACSSTHAEYDMLWPLSHSDMAAFWTEAYRQGYTYVVSQEDYVLDHLYFGSVPSPGSAPPWLDVEPVYGKPGDKQIIYRLSAQSAPVQVERKCTSDGAGRWLVEPSGE